MTLEQFKKKVGGIPDQYNKLHIYPYIIENDYIESGHVTDNLTFHDWEYHKENVGEEISFLFFKGYKNYGE